MRACTCTFKVRGVSTHHSRSTLPQVVHDFNHSAIALRRYFGAEFAINQILDLQLAFEAVHGRVGADAVSVMRAFGSDASCSDAASRCHLLPSPVLVSFARDGTACPTTSTVTAYFCGVHVPAGVATATAVEDPVEVVCR